MESGSIVDVLVVAAHLPELEGLRPTLGSDLRAEVAGTKVVGRPVGIGVCASAIGAADVISAYAPRAVVLVGTCGAYRRRGFGIGDLAAAHRLDLVSTAVVEKRGWWPKAMQRDTFTNRAISEALGRDGVRSANIATTLAISSDDALAQEISAEYDCDLEHLEVFAVAAACAARSVPFGAILGVANHVGPRAHDEWLAHHISVGERAAGHVGAWLRAGAPGLREAAEVSPSAL